MLKKALRKPYSESNPMFELFKMFPDDVIAEKCSSGKHWFSVHTNRIELLWSTLKQTPKGIFQKMSLKYLDRYVQEFAEWHNVKKMDTIDIMNSLVSNMDYKKLKYDDLITNNELSNGAWL